MCYTEKKEQRMKSNLGAIASVCLILCLAAGLLSVGLIASDGVIRTSSGEFRLLPELNLLAYPRRDSAPTEEYIAYLSQRSDDADSLRDAGSGLPTRLISVWAWMALVNIFAVWLLRLLGAPLSQAAKRAFILTTALYVLLRIAALWLSNIRIPAWSEAVLEEFYPAAFVAPGTLTIPALALGVLTVIARLTRGDGDPEGPSVESEDS